MPATASDLELVPPNFALWQAYDPSVKADLFSTAVLARSRRYLVDPIPLAAPALAALRPDSQAILLTNANHQRAALDYASALGIPIFAHPAAFPGLAAVTPLGPQLDGLEIVSIEGAAAGEIALYLPEDGGALIMGDALINFESLGFTFLPAKYCSNHKLMRKSLRQLLNFPVRRIFFAHGPPLLQDSAERLHALFNGND